MSLYVISKRELTFIVNQQFTSSFRVLFYYQLIFHCAVNTNLVPAHCITNSKPLVYNFREHSHHSKEQITVCNVVMPHQFWRRDWHLAELSIHL